MARLLEACLNKTGYTMKKKFKINGMHCAGCVNSVQKSLEKIEGVKSASVQLVTESAEVEFENGSVSFDQIREAVESAGFEAESPKTESVTFEIGGMHCTGCSSAVEKAVKRLDGVINVSVNLTAEKAFVEYDSSQLSASRISQGITDAGYEVLGEQKKKPIN
jgi:P-type Cu+ transporter